MLRKKSSVAMMPMYPLLGSDWVGSSRLNGTVASTICIREVAITWLDAIVPGLVVRAVVEIDASTWVVFPPTRSGASGSRLTMVTTKTSLSRGDSGRLTLVAVKVFAALSVTDAEIRTVSLDFLSAMIHVQFHLLYSLVSRVN